MSTEPTADGMMKTYIDVATPTIMSFILVMAGMTIYWVFWMREGWVKTPVYDIESRVYHSSDKDKPHKNPFSFLFEVVRIIYSDRAMSFINRYGIEMYFFFQIRLFFLRTMVFIFFGLAIMITIGGLIWNWSSEYLMLIIKIRLFGGGCQMDKNRVCLIE
jgi:hypothetical protein